MYALRVFLTVVTVGALAACQSDATEPTGSASDVVSARVVFVAPPSEYTRVLVNDGGSLAVSDTTWQYYLVVSPSTRIMLRQSNGRLVPGRLRDITPGDSVRAWRTGMELRSLPPQYPVSRIEVTPAIAP